MVSMTAVELHRADTPAGIPGPRSISLWAHEAKEAAKVAASLAKTPFVPASLRERPANRDPEEITRAAAVTAANITAAILTGQEIGLEPMAALRSIDVVQGTPALRAITLRAVVLAAGHDMWVAESTQTRAVVRGQRKGSDRVQESVWTLDRARSLSLAGKDNWRKQPAAMLVARATSECARLVAADAILGIPYSAEELADGAAEIDAEPVREVAPVRRTAQRRSNRQPAAVHRPPVPELERAADPEPGFDEDDGPGSAPPAAGITKPQQRTILAAYKDLGVTDRAERLADASAFLGRELSSSNDITKDEATQLIDDLTRRRRGNPAEPDDETLAAIEAESAGDPPDDQPRSELFRGER
jgi:hypothetical protein